MITSYLMFLHISVILFTGRAYMPPATPPAMHTLCYTCPIPPATHAQCHAHPCHTCPPAMHTPKYACPSPLQCICPAMYVPLPCMTSCFPTPTMHTTCQTCPCHAHPCHERPTAILASPSVLAPKPCMPS